MAKGNKPKTKEVKAKRARAKWAKAKKAKGKKRYPRTPKTFHRFLDLPKELRLKVWEQALFEARPDRRIIVYEFRVVPFKQSISPLLLVNYESRTCAKAFYNVKLDVYAVPGLSDSQIRFLDKQKQWARIPGIETAVDGKIHNYTDTWIRTMFDFKRSDVKSGFAAGACDHDDGLRHSPFQEEGYRYDDELRRSPRLQEEECQKIDHIESQYTIHLEDHWSEYVEERLRRWGSKSAAKAEELGLIKGALYISPWHDVFIEGYDCGRHFHIENASNIFGAKLKQRVACHHVTTMLDAATRERISTSVLVRPQVSSGLHHCVFARRTLIGYGCQPWLYEDCFYEDESEWNEEALPSVKSYFILRPFIYDEPGVLQKLIEADRLELSQILERWVNKGSSLGLSGNTVWNFEKTKGFDGFGPMKPPADWTREMMAHWDVGHAESV